jgi:hypothetical protein
MTYGVYMAAKKLKHYFQEHPIRVVAEAPISEIISNKDASGRIAKWAIELSPYTPQYDKRDTIKSQVLANFFIDWAEIQYEPPLPDANYRRMHFDGSMSWFHQQICHRGRCMAVCGRGEHGGAIRDGGSTSLPSFRFRNSGETLRAAIIHYMATSARLQ